MGFFRLPLMNWILETMELKKIDMRNYTSCDCCKNHIEKNKIITYKYGDSFRFCSPECFNYYWGKVNED